MKKCTKCGEVKSYSEFPIKKSTKDGFNYRCKTCKNKIQNEYRKGYYKEHTEQTREYYRKYYNLNKEVILAKISKWQRTVAGKACQKERTKKYHKKYPERLKAVMAFNYYKKVNKISSGQCEVCSDNKTQAHHDDYNKPLKIRWLCSKHHIGWHRDNNPTESIFERQASA